MNNISEGKTMRAVERKSGRWLSGALAACLVLVACDTEVTNPGPVQDDFLNEPEAQPAMVQGTLRALGDALNWIAYTSSAVAREVHPSGSTGSFGISVRQQSGELRDDEVNTHWENAHRARASGEGTVSRVEATETGWIDETLRDEAYLFTAFAFRLLAENMCEAVFDGGSAMPNSEYATRAVQWFDRAAGSGNADVRLAALGGRASMKVWMGDWAGAVSDASQVPTAFSYDLDYQAIGDDFQSNRIHIASKNQPYKAHTAWTTWVGGDGDQFAAMGQEVDAAGNVVADGDPRVQWRASDENGDAAISCCGQVPWWPQVKHGEDASPIELTGGAEMRLIEAEDMLRNGDVSGAMAKINELRARPTVGLPPLTATTVDEARVILKAEYAAETWLEGRRLPQLWRWSQTGFGTEQDLHPLEQVSGSTDSGSHLVQRDYCFPISQGEKQTNSNVS
jgi:hypothetical protein